MAYTYRIIGARFVRKYVATDRTATANIVADAAKIGDGLAAAAWEAAEKKEAAFPRYGDESLVSGQASYDAAAFCADFGDGDGDGLQRVYANEAVYRYKIPTDAVGAVVSSLAATVSCDPFNTAGARVHVFTNDTGVIPSARSDVRGEDASGAVVVDGSTAAGFAPRETLEVGGVVHWCPATAVATLAPKGGLKLGRYLFVSVGLESYGIVRGTNVEGAAFVANGAADGVSVTLDREVPGWSSSSSVDLSTGGVSGGGSGSGDSGGSESGDSGGSGTGGGSSSSVVLAGGAQPTWLQPLGADAAVNTDGTQSWTVQRMVVSTDNKCVFWWRYTVTATVATEAFEVKAECCHVQSPAPLDADTEPSFVEVAAQRKLFTQTVTLNERTFGQTESFWLFRYEADGCQNTCRLVAYVDDNSDAMLVLFNQENGSSDYDDATPVYTSIDDGAYTLGPLAGADASSQVRNGTGDDEVLGDLSWQVATGDREQAARTSGDTFLHLVGLLGSTAGKVAQDYAAADGAFPLSDLDRVTVVPRFARGAAVSEGYAAAPQPGLSLWYHKSRSEFSKRDRVGNASKGEVVNCCSAPSFLQGAYLVVRAPSAGTRLTFTAAGAVENTGISFRLAVWRSSGEAWDRAAGFHTAAQLPKTAGFANAGVENFTVEEFNFADGVYAGLPSLGAVEVDLLGLSETVSGALAKGDSFSVALSATVEEGDALVVAPVPVAYTAGYSATDAYFGRKSAPSVDAAKAGWCRAETDIGWFPQIEIS